MKKRLWFITVIVLAAVLAVTGYVMNRLGRVKDVSLAADKVEKADCLRLRGTDGFWLEMRRGTGGRWSAQSSEGDFTPDAGRIEDFLHVLNLWEPAEIAALDAYGITAAVPVHPMRLTVKQGRKKLLNLKTFISGEDFYVCVNRREAYKMACSWQRSSWTDFFLPSTAVWQNRLLVDLDYFEIASVQIDDMLIEAAPENDGYFSAFKHVYFDRPAVLCLGLQQQEIEINTKDGRRFSFRIFAKLHPDGTADPFRAYVVKGTAPGDTVEVPYVILDKMTGVGSGF